MVKYIFEREVFKMPKTGKNIFKRKDGRWEHRFISCYEDGKACYKSVYGKDCSEVKSKMKNNIPLNIAAAKTTVTDETSMGTVCNQWLESIGIRLKESTVANYYHIINVHIKPYFRNIGIKQITNGLLDDFIKQKSTDLSAKTVKKTVLLLFRILKWADRKICFLGLDYDGIILPKQQNKVLSVLEKSEQITLIQYIDENPSNETLGLLIALFTGLRISELSALKWGDIDFDTASIKVTKSLQRIQDISPDRKTKTKIIIGTPKSEKSMRKIPIPSFMLDLLRIRSFGHTSSDYLLTGNSSYMEPRTFQRRYAGHIKKAGIVYRNFHTIRHTFATRAVEVGFDLKSLSEILGHSSVKLTLDKYVHSLDKQKRDCMEKLIEIF